ncbi:lipase family protein [Undibacterium sp. TJN19]|uniref:lipase family protein n=1 Tax=Undibacterium sp. TJN19 TaxID=3413055 RepID=UPI003BF0E6A3
MDYDPTKTALYHPELQPALLNADKKWTRHAACAELSRLAYTRFEKGDPHLADLKKTLHDAQFSSAQFFQNAATGTQAFATTSKDGQSAFLVFRGTQTDDLSDIIKDGEFLPVTWGDRGKVHLGFLQAFQSIEAELDAWISACQASIIWISGHSLGAALATLAAAKYTKTHLVTFGSPRVGDGQFADAFIGRDVARYVDCSDLVSFLPPDSIFYKHLRGLHYIDKHGRIMPDMTAADILADQTVAKAEYLIESSWKLANVGFRSMADHAPINYVRALLGEI